MAAPGALLLERDGELGRVDASLTAAAGGIGAALLIEGRLEHAPALIDLGAALRRAGHRREARQPLREGYELALNCGADTLTETARVELNATGIRLRRPALAGVDSFTASERRTADMAAANASNAKSAHSAMATASSTSPRDPACPLARRRLSIPLAPSPTCRRELC